MPSSTITISLRTLVTLAVYSFFLDNVYCVDTCSSVNCGTNSCCADVNNGPLCYNSAQYDCVEGAHLCQKGFLACGSACYSPSSYSCVNGGLQQTATGPSSPTATTPVTPAATSAPTTTQATTASPTTAKATTASPTTAKATTSTTAPAVPVLSADFFANSTVYQNGAIASWEAYYYSVSTGKWRIDDGFVVSYLQRLDLGTYFQYAPAGSSCLVYNDVAAFTSYWSWVANSTYAGSCATNGIAGNLWTYHYSNIPSELVATYYLCESNAIPMNFTSVSVNIQGIKQTQSNIFSHYTPGTPADDVFAVPSQCSS